MERGLTSGLKIIFDFGTTTTYKMWGSTSNKLKFVDENGEELKYNSMVDAANYMVDRGWIFQHAYTSFDGGSPVIHWIFHKDAKDMDEAKEGILTKSDFKE